MPTTTAATANATPETLETYMEKSSDILPDYSNPFSANPRRFGTGERRSGGTAKTGNGSARCVQSLSECGRTAPFSATIRPKFPSPASALRRRTADNPQTCDSTRVTDQARVACAESCPSHEPGSAEPRPRSIPQVPCWDRNGTYHNCSPHQCPRPTSAWFRRTREHSFRQSD